MNFDEKLNKIYSLYLKKIEANDIQNVSSLMIGAYDIAVRQYPVETQELLAKYLIDKDLIKYKNMCQKLYSLIDSYEIDLITLRSKIIKNGQIIETKFFDINEYISSKNILNEIDLFFVKCVMSNESNFKAFQLYNAIQEVQKIKK